ncbi:MAG: OmpA family protein [Myxococcales bacterium]|nr:OmpA family protein [Myxococcales bacterium]
MTTSYSYRLGGSAAILSALAMLTGEPQSAHAEINAGVFTGAHLFNDNNKLSRQDRATSDNGFDHSAIVGLRIAYVPIPRLAIEAELGIIPTSTHDGSSRLGVLSARGHLLLNLLTGRVRPFLLAGGGGMFSMMAIGSKLPADSEGALHAGGGLQVDITKLWGLRIDGRAVFPQALSSALTTEGEILVGLAGRFDVQGTAPAVAPVPAPTPAMVPATPPPVVDSDGDGIVDTIDKCPTAAGLPVNAGCPDQDSDSDGVVDRLDKCPSEAGIKENDGCADKDSDGDGIVDRLDKCPSEPETKNQFQDEDGCADELPKEVAQFSGAIAGIVFAPNRTEITAATRPVLDQAVAVLAQYSSVRLQIEGHTDNAGPADQNRKLSQQRADAVRQYMIDKGIDGARLTAVGFGPDKPIADNKTAAGRAKNRRVEFTRVPVQ